MISHVERDLEEMYQFLKDFTYTMTMAPVPPAGNVIVVCFMQISVSASYTSSIFKYCNVNMEDKSKV